MSVVVASALLGPGVASAGKARASTLRAIAAPQAAVAGLDLELSERCRAVVEQELRTGQRQDVRCREDRETAGRALVRRRDAFGFVEQRQVNLSRLRLVLGVGRRCKQWPLRSPGRDVLRRTDVVRAGCRLRRYQDQVSLVFVDREGRRHQPLPPISTDQDGRLLLHFADVDRALRSLGAGSIDEYTHIELGSEAWAGRVDLERLLSFRADWHLAWLSQGRGAPGLFVARHPDHPGAHDARTMAADALLSRQERDYERVQDGTFAPQSFLDRHGWSPYRHRVQAWLLMPAKGTANGGSSPTVRATEAHQRGDASSATAPAP